MKDCFLALILGKDMWLIPRLESMATWHTTPGRRIGPADGPDWTSVENFTKHPLIFAKNNPQPSRSARG
jgi:hypothetical protein